MIKKKMAKAKKEKELNDRRVLKPKFIYVFEGGTYRNSNDLCDSLGLSYIHFRRIINENNNVYVKKINVTKEKKGKDIIYKNGIFTIQLNEFCTKFKLNKTEVLESIKNNGSFQKQIEITRHQDYSVELNYVINGVRYPAKD